jgi:antitoxin HigA-1
MRTKSRSSTTTRRATARKVHPPVHPGEVLAEDFLRPMGLTQYRLAKGTRVPPRRINEIVHGVRSISADTALRLARFFGTSEQFWLNLQTRYDLEKERDRLGGRLLKDVEVWRGRLARGA